jgi:hypothetical protein
MQRIYLDYNASTPIAPEVAEAMRPFLDQAYGNPSSQHWAGRPAREAVDAARQSVAELLGCQADEIVFTSGGSEAGKLAGKAPGSSRHGSNTRPSSSRAGFSRGSGPRSPGCRSMARGASIPAICAGPLPAIPS